MHPYYREPNKIHPEIPEARESAKHIETEQEKKLRLAREFEELKQAGKRERYFAKHKTVEPDPYKINQTEGVRLGRKNAKEHNPEWVIPFHSSWGRIAKQSEVQKSGVTAGWGDYSRAFEKARNPTKVNKNRPAQAHEKKKREVEEKKKNGIYV